MYRFILMISVLVLLIVSYSEAAVFNVSNPAQFQTALNTASSNGQNDTINVNGGTYNLGATLTYTPAAGENFSLTIQSGTGTPVLDGGSTMQILNIDTTGLASDTNAHIVIQGISFRNSDNTGGNGGGLYVMTSDANISISGCDFRDHTADRGACSYARSDSSATISYSGNTFSGTNNAVGGSGGCASASTNNGGTVLFINNNVSGGNTSSSSGGAVYLNTNMDGTMTITGNTFSGINTSGSSGGVLYTNTNGRGIMTISNNTFSGTNTAGSRGGCINANTNEDSTVTFTNNTIMGSNTAGSNGGGIYLNTNWNGNVTFSRNTIFGGGNIASNDGGAVYINTNYSSVATIENNTISGTNTATNGGGLRVNTGDGGTLNIINNTVTGNIASITGGGIYLPLNSSETANVYNNLIWNNTAGVGGNDGDDLYIETSSVTTVNLFNNLLGQNANFATASSEDLLITDISNYAQGSNIATATAMIGSIGDNGGPTWTHALQAGSPAIDNGTNSVAPLTDQRGYVRIWDGDGNSTAIVDMGAYEFGAPSTATPVPTLTEWGMIIFTILAGTGSLYYLRRRKSTLNT